MSALIQQVENLRQQLIREHAQAPGLFREMANVESLLAETYRARVLYELLQNSDDAGSTVVDVDLRTPGKLVWRNNGRPFTLVDIEALCRSASSTKQRGGGAIGYRGIGFKAVAAVAHEVTVTSGGVTLDFDRAGAARALGTSPAETPLLRVPAHITNGVFRDGAEFTLKLANHTNDQLQLNPVALLFLRNVAEVVIQRPEGSDNIRCSRDSSMVALTVGGSTARFHHLADSDNVLLIPADPHAEALAGRRGRLACFLPLDDELGVPIIASGHVLTDPSRTHAVLRDPSTRQVLATISDLLAGVLIDNTGPAFDRLWELLVAGEDLRTLALAGDTTIPGHLLSGTKTALATREWPFSFTEVAIDAADLPTVFPAGAPAALYTEGATSQSRALRTVFGAPTLRTGQLVELLDPDRLTSATRNRLATRVVETARVEGRTLTPREQALVGKSSAPGPAAASNTVTVRNAPSGMITTFGGAIARWRAAEVAAMEYLNSRGWKLTDVSRQNVGYDLEGTTPDGHSVHLEVKKVEGKDSRFALTNNELSVMIAASGRYILALVIGDGNNAQLALLDPLKDQVPRERVCRRWEWEYTDWSRFAELVP